MTQAGSVPAFRETPDSLLLGAAAARGTPVATGDHPIGTGADWGHEPRVLSCPPA